MSASEILKPYWDGYGFDHPRSGVFVHAERLAREIVPLGCRPIVLTPRGEWPVQDNGRLPQTQPAVGRLSKIMRSKLVWSQLCQRHLKRLGNQPVLYHGLSNINLPLLAMDRHRTRFIVTIHDLTPLLSPSAVSRSYYWQFRLAIPRVLNLADRIVCVSQWTKSTVLARWPNLARKISVIPNGVAVIKPWVALATSGGIRAIAVGRFEAYKRMNMLPSILERARDLRLTVATDEKGASYFRKNAGKYVHSQRLKILIDAGEEELRDEYQKAHVCVHPSLYEGFGLVPAEALAQARPVVYCRGSAVDEVIGSTGGIGLPADATIEDWCHAIETAAKWHDRSDFHATLDRHIQKLKSWKDAASDLKNLYNDVLGI